jgi:hypothetical protein
VRCDQCPNEGQCANEQFEACIIHDPDHKPSRLHPVFQDARDKSFRTMRRLNPDSLFDRVEV